MEAIKKYLVDNFEGGFVLVILVFVSVTVWLVEAKLSFLNFFYLPILLSSYYLGTRSGVLGAFFTFLVIALFASIYPDRFTASLDNFGLAASVLTWGGFLILTAVIVGFTHRELQDKVTEALLSKAEASGNAELLEQTMAMAAIVLPLSVISVTVAVLHPAFSIALAFSPQAIIRATISVLHHPLSVKNVACPLSAV